jgi:hypothetical protein
MKFIWQGKASPGKDPMIAMYEERIEEHEVSERWGGKMTKNEATALA